ncbi:MULTISPECIES: hypothetical protein [unclassified Bradyrhizobium]|uniref:hypothetical protein n=1 Tax=unclassified Bradyrhizobium TaxID=2631580 RepID=UPI001FF6FC31|nr:MULTISPECIES: hypothetical protein [unclassified Bradyrhizobium]MCJ9700242.1 hypothetical protein [Bradyrhizobium sp. SHOUNA76]MCJ9730064.1 hypothetical protein [Bradyrhizobium sp. PRIMUS42]
MNLATWQAVASNLGASFLPAASQADGRLGPARITLDLRQSDDAAQADGVL